MQPLQLLEMYFIFHHCTEPKISIVTLSILTEPKELADLQIGKLNELILAEGKLNEEVLNNLSIDSKDIVPFIRQSQVQVDEKEIALSIHRLHEHNKWRSPPPLGGGSGGSSEGRQEQEVHMVDLSMTEETS